MPQFNPDMTKDELVNAFSSKYPALSSLSINDAYGKIVSRYPQYKLHTLLQRKEKQIYGILFQTG